MKKILLFIFLLPTLAFAQLELPFPIKLVNPKPVDFWYFESDGTPYDNTGEVTTQVLSAIRYIGQTFNVNGVEYWFKDGITDGDLIAKGGGSVDTTAFIKTQGTSVLTADATVDMGDKLFSFYSAASGAGFSFDNSSGNELITLGYSNLGFNVDKVAGSASISVPYGNNFLIGDGGNKYIEYNSTLGQFNFQTPSGGQTNFINGGLLYILRDDGTGGLKLGDISGSVTLMGVPLIDQSPATSTVGDELLIRDSSTGEIQKLGIGTGLSISAGDLVSSGGGGGADALGTYLVQTATNAPANAQIMGSLATGIVKNTTTTGVQSIAVAADFPTLNQNTTGNAATVTTNANLTGDVTSTGNATAIASGVIVNADINASAAIGATKLIDGSITDTELGYINTLSSNAQTQITAREVLTNKATDLSTFNSTLYPTTASLFARRDVTGTDAIVQADNGKTIYFNSGSPFNFTIDALTTNSSVYFYNKGSATVTFVDGSGVTSTGVTSLAAGESGGIIYESSTTPIILGTPSGGGGGLTVGTSTITSGTNTKVLYNNSGVLGEYTVSGTGNVALTTSPVFTTPNIGTATGTASGNYSLASGGTATGTNTFAMGSNPFILTSGVTTGTGATAGIQNVFNSLTTGNGLDISTSSLTSGKGLALTSTSTAINHTMGTNALFSSRISGANANSTRTAIAGEFVATNTGTSSTNTAVYAAASGGTNNYSIYASGQMYVEGIASSGYVAWFKASGVNKGIYISSTGHGVIPLSNNTTDLGNISQQFKNAFVYGNVAAGGITTVLARIHSRGAGTTTGYNILTENSSATARFGVRDNGAIEFSGSAGTSGYLLQSNGATSPPTWVAPTNTNVQANVTNYKYSLVGFPSGTLGSLGTPVTSAQLANGESVTIVVHWSAMDGDSNTGAGGTFITTWTKSGGTLNKVMDLNTGLTGSDTGDALAVSSSDSGGDILISLGTGTIAGNMKASGIAEVTINK